MRRARDRDIRWAYVALNRQFLRKRAGIEYAPERAPHALAHDVLAHVDLAARRGRSAAVLVRVFALLFFGFAIGAFVFAVRASSAPPFDRVPAMTTIVDTDNNSYDQETGDVETPEQSAEETPEAGQGE